MERLYNMYSISKGHCILHWLNISDYVPLRLNKNVQGQKMPIVFCFKTIGIHRLFLAISKVAENVPGLFPHFF